MTRKKLGKSQSLIRGLPLHAYIIQVTTSYLGNATLTPFTLLLLFILPFSNTDLGIGVALPTYSQSLRSYYLFHCVGKFIFGALESGIQQACHVTNQKMCINRGYKMDVDICIGVSKWETLVYPDNVKPNYLKSLIFSYFSVLSKMCKF